MQCTRRNNASVFRKEQHRVHAGIHEGYDVEGVGGRLLRPILLQLVVLVLCVCVVVCVFMCVFVVRRTNVGVSVLTCFNECTNLDPHHEKLREDIHTSCTTVAERTSPCPR